MLRKVGLTALIGPEAIPLVTSSPLRPASALSLGEWFCLCPDRCGIGQTLNPHNDHSRPAGSSFGDFRTPSGVRNSSRERNGCFRVEEDKNRAKLLVIGSVGAIECDIDP